MLNTLEQLFGELDEMHARLRGEMHHHKCPEPNCGHIWSHRAADFDSSEEHQNGHTCPVCKKGQQTWKCDANGNMH